PNSLRPWEFPHRLHAARMRQCSEPSNHPIHFTTVQPANSLRMWTQSQQMWHARHEFLLSNVLTLSPRCGHATTQSRTYHHRNPRNLKRKIKERVQTHNHEDREAGQWDEPEAPPLSDPPEIRRDQHGVGQECT